MIVFVRNFFAILAFGIILRGQQIGKNSFQSSINDLLLTISSIYSFSQMNYKKLIFVELISVILFMLYILFIGDSIIIKELDWFHIGFYFLVSLLLLPDSIEIMKLNKEKEKLEEEQDE